MPKKGYKQTEEHKKKVVIQLSAHRHNFPKNNYFGKLPDGEYLHRKSQERGDYFYSKWKLLVLQRDNWICQGCNQRKNFLIPHHIKSWKKYPKLRYDVNNGVTLCSSCHQILEKNIIK